MPLNGHGSLLSSRCSNSTVRVVRSEKKIKVESQRESCYLEVHWTDPGCCAIVWCTMGDFYAVSCERQKRKFFGLLSGICGLFWTKNLVFQLYRHQSNLKLIYYPKINFCKYLSQSNWNLLIHRKSNVSQSTMEIRCYLPSYSNYDFFRSAFREF